MSHSREPAKTTARSAPAGDGVVPSSEHRPPSDAPALRRIKLTECQIEVINLPGDTLRLEAVTALCRELGLPHNVVNAVSRTPGWIGCALSHLQALWNWDRKRPLLILEDDIAVTPDYTAELDIPSDADALYLGTSRFGGVELMNWMGIYNLVAARQVSPDLARIYNLLGAHAIVHISEAWIEAATQAILECLFDRHLPHDSGFARIQQDHVVYCPIEPFFFQAAELQPEVIAEHRERMTKVSLPIHPEGTIFRYDLSPHGMGEHTFRLDKADDRMFWTAID